MIGTVSLFNVIIIGSFTSSISIASLLLLSVLLLLSKWNYFDVTVTVSVVFVVVVFLFSRKGWKEQIAPQDRDSSSSSYWFDSCRRSIQWKLIFWKDAGIGIIVGVEAVEELDDDDDDDDDDGDDGDDDDNDYDESEKEDEDDDEELELKVEPW